MKNKLFILIFMIATLGINAKAQSEIQLQTGDLLFRGTLSSGLSQAIDQVTQTEKQTHFSHVGLVVLERDSVFILHASPTGGTCRVTLDEFSHPEGDSVHVVAYRLQEQWQNVIPQAIKKAYGLLGKPYNFSYILSDSSHYCSEFIYRAFAEDSIFKLNPMTFKDPDTGEYLPAWIKYYKNQGLEIPERMPGCNPNEMAASEKLERIGTNRGLPQPPEP